MLNLRLHHALMSASGVCGHPPTLCTARQIPLPSELVSVQGVSCSTKLRFYTGHHLWHSSCPYLLMRLLCWHSKSTCKPPCFPLTCHAAFCLCMLQHSNAHIQLAQHGRQQSRTGKQLMRFSFLKSLSTCQLKNGKLAPLLIWRQLGANINIANLGSQDLTDLTA